MTDISISETAGADSQVDGRPGQGAALASQISEAAARRPKGKTIRPLGHILPFIVAHRLDALAAFFFC